jgi:hypothetical protein
VIKFAKKLTLIPENDFLVSRSQSYNVFIVTVVTGVAGRQKYLTQI